MKNEKYFSSCKTALLSKKKYGRFTLFVKFHKRRQLYLSTAMFAHLVTAFPTLKIVMAEFSNICHRFLQ